VRPGLRARQCPTVRQRPTVSDSVRQRPTASDSVRQQITCSHATNCPTGSDRVRQGPTVPTADSPTVSDNVRQSDTRVRQFGQFRGLNSAQSRVGVSHVGIPGKSGLNSLTMRSPAMAIATRFQIPPRSLWWSQWFPCSAKRLTTPPKLQSPVTKIPVVLRRSLFY
jgi:hypothetical protein